MDNKKGISITLDSVLVDEARRKCSRYGIGFNRLVNSLIQQFVVNGEVFMVVQLNNSRVEVEDTKDELDEEALGLPRASVSRLKPFRRGTGREKPQAV